MIASFRFCTLTAVVIGQGVIGQWRTGGSLAAEFPVKLPAGLASVAYLYST